MKTSVSYSGITKGENYYINMEDKYEKQFTQPQKRNRAAKEQMLSKTLRYLASKPEKRNMILLSCRKTAA